MWTISKNFGQEIAIPNVLNLSSIRITLLYAAKQCTVFAGHISIENITKREREKEKEKEKLSKLSDFQ
jgi:hypothetical protein